MMKNIEIVLIPLTQLSPSSSFDSFPSFLTFADGRGEKFCIEGSTSGFFMLTDDRKWFHNLVNHRVFSQLSTLCCVNDVKVEKSAECDDGNEAQQGKAVVEEFFRKLCDSNADAAVSHPNTSSAPLNRRLSLVWHIFGFTDTLSLPVTDRMNKTTSSFEQEAGKQTPQWTTVEFLI